MIELIDNWLFMISCCPWLWILVLIFGLSWVSYVKLLGFMWSHFVAVCVGSLVHSLLGVPVFCDLWVGFWVYFAFIWVWLGMPFLDM